MSAKDIEEKTERLAESVLGEKGFELVDVEYVKEGADNYLRVFIDKPEGITIGDCEDVSRALEKLLDEGDFLTCPYILEISSPGLTRELKKEKDYVRNKGRLVEIHLYSARGKDKIFTGLLDSWDSSTVTINSGGAAETFERRNISLIRQTFEW